MPMMPFLGAGLGQMAANASQGQLQGQLYKLMMEREDEKNRQAQDRFDKELSLRRDMYGLQAELNPEKKRGMMLENQTRETLLPYQATAAGLSNQAAQQNLGYTADANKRANELHGLTMDSKSFEEMAKGFALLNNLRMTNQIDDEGFKAAWNDIRKRTGQNWPDITPGRGFYTIGGDYLLNTNAVQDAVEAYKNAGPQYQANVPLEKHLHDSQALMPLTKDKNALDTKVKVAKDAINPILKAMGINENEDTLTVARTLEQKLNDVPPNFRNAVTNYLALVNYYIQSIGVPVAQTQGVPSTGGPSVKRFNLDKGIFE